MAEVVAGAALLLQVAVIGALFRATADKVYFLGRELTLFCAFKRSTGLPCPTCGATRGFLLSISGHLVEGWNLNPLGPMLAWGMVGTGLMLIAFGLGRGLFPNVRWERGVPIARRVLLACCAAGLVVWVTAWIRALVQAL